MATSVGEVFIGSMNMRGAWADRSALPKNDRGQDVQMVNVTSAQGGTNVNRVDFSPMHMANGTYMDRDKGVYGSFEHYWQARKVIEGLDHEERNEWWKGLTKAKRRDPRMINKDKTRKKVLYAVHKRLPGRQLNYVDSRKLIYVPDYHAKIKDGRGIRRLKGTMGSGYSIVIMDFDGPRNDDGSPTVEKVTVEMLKRKVADERVPFGHGYVVAATALGIEPEAYCGAYPSFCGGDSSSP